MTPGAALRPPAPGPLRAGAALSQDCTFFAALVCDDATDSRARAHQRPRAARRTRAPSLGLALVTLMGAACVPRLQPCGARTDGMLRRYAPPGAARGRWLGTGGRGLAGGEGRSRLQTIFLKHLGLRGGGGCCGGAPQVASPWMAVGPAIAAAGGGNAGEPVLPEAYMTDEQAHEELAELGVEIEAVPGLKPPQEKGTDDMEDLARDLDDAHLDVEQPAEHTPAEPESPAGQGRKPGLLTSTPLELKQNHPEVYEMMAELLGEIPSVPAPRATHGAESYALSDALAQAQQHRRELEAVTRQDREFGAFVADPSCAAQLLLFGLSPDDEAAEVVRLLAAPDLMVPRDASSVAEGLGMLEPGQMLLIAATQRWQGQLDVAGSGINIAADAVGLFGSWALQPGSQGTLTSVSAINGALVTSTDAMSPPATEVVDTAGSGGTSSTVLALGGPWDVRACEVLSVGGRAALTAADYAIVSLSGCVLGGAAAARSPLLTSEELAHLRVGAQGQHGPGAGEGGGGGSREVANSRGENSGHGVACDRGPMMHVSSSGPIMAVSLLGHAECSMVECSLLFADGSLSQWAECGPVRSGAVGLSCWLSRSLPPA